MKIEKTSDNFQTRYCKRTKAGHITTLTELSAVPTQPPIIKLNATEYINTATGEINEFNQSADRSDNKDSLRKTFRRIRDLINTNCTEPEHLHWITLTYAENMTDTKQLYSDFDKFLKRFKYYCKNQGYNTPEYISVIEPQSRGAWHIHLIFIWDRVRPYIANNSTFAPMWGHGFTKIQACPNSDNLGAYLSAYLGDIPLSEYSGDTTKASIKVVKGKRYVKGGRLSLYPVGMNIVRHSRGIKKPEFAVIAPDDIEKEKASAGTLTFSRSLLLSSDIPNSSDSGKPEKLYIRHSYYNAKRGKSQASGHAAEKLLRSALALGIDCREEHTTDF